MKIAYVKKNQNKKYVLGSLTWHEGDGNENVKIIGLLKQNINTARSPYLLDYDVKFPNDFLLLNQSFGVNRGN